MGIVYVMLVLVSSPPARHSSPPSPGPGGASRSACRPAYWRGGTSAGWRPAGWTSAVRSCSRCSGTADPPSSRPRQAPARDAPALAPYLGRVLPGLRRDPAVPAGRRTGDLPAHRQRRHEVLVPRPLRGQARGSGVVIAAWPLLGLAMYAYGGLTYCSAKPVPDGSVAVAAELGLPPMAARGARGCGRSGASRRLRRPRRSGRRYRRSRSRLIDGSLSVGGVAQAAASSANF